jgi:hypothetical protein
MTERRTAARVNALAAPELDMPMTDWANRQAFLA